MTKIALLLLFAVSCSAWTWKKDTTPKLKEELEATAARDLDDFVKGDEASRTALYKEPLEILKQVEKNNEKVLYYLEPVEKLMKTLSGGERFSFLRLRALQLIASTLDGNNENFSHWKLEAVREFALRRVHAGVGGHDGEILNQLIDEVESAKDSLEKMTRTFIFGVKEIKEETSHSGKEDHEKIKAASDKIVQVGQELKPVLRKNTADAIALLEKRVQQE